MHMRNRVGVDLKSSDRQLFQKLETGDLWIDARMPEVWHYLYTSKHVSIPLSWQHAMSTFNDEIIQIAASLHYCLH